MTKNRSYLGFISSYQVFSPRLQFSPVTIETYCIPAAGDTLENNHSLCLSGASLAGERHALSISLIIHVIGPQRENAGHDENCTAVLNLTRRFDSDFDEKVT